MNNQTERDEQEESPVSEDYHSVEEYRTLLLPTDIDDALATLAEGTDKSVNGHLIAYFEAKEESAAGRLQGWLNTLRFDSDATQKRARSKPAQPAVQRRVVLARWINQAFEREAEEVRVRTLPERSNVYNALFARAAREFLAENGIQVDEPVPEPVPEPVEPAATKSA